MQSRYSNALQAWYGREPGFRSIPGLANHVTGVVKTYRLTYEPVEVQHALFDKSRTQNQWVIDSKFLREIVEYFGPTAEQLDIYTDNGKAVFTSFTTKVTNGKGAQTPKAVYEYIKSNVYLEILKQPVHTSVAIDIKDFESCSVKEKLHVAISVKDFKAIIMHADTLKTVITARYTRPCRPLQLSYGSNGMVCEFTLMTRGEAGDVDVASNYDTRELSARPYTRLTQTPPVNNEGSGAMAVPEAHPRNEAVEQPIRARVVEETPQSVPSGTSTSLGHNSLFVPIDDDRQWDEPQYEDEQEEDVLGWDANMDHVRQLRPSHSAWVMRLTFPRRLCGLVWVVRFKTVLSRPWNRINAMMKPTLRPFLPRREYPK